MICVKASVIVKTEFPFGIFAAMVFPTPCLTVKNHPRYSVRGEIIIGKKKQFPTGSWELR